MAAAEEWVEDTTEWSTTDDCRKLRKQLIEDWRLDLLLTGEERVSDWLLFCYNAAALCCY